MKGGHTGVKDVREFTHVLDANEALMGIFICFHRTREMVVEAENVGFASHHRKAPKLQILTIKELLEEKKRPNIPEGCTPRRSSGVGRPAVKQFAFEDTVEEEA